MKFKTLLFFSLFWGSLVSLNGQDAFHYTLFDFTGPAMNPAIAGSFEGTVRGGGLFREQDYGLQIGQFRNPVVYLDAPVIRGFGKNDWIGIGMYYMYDVQKYGDVNLVTNKVFGGLSYHIPLDKKLKNVLSLGIQSGSATSYFTRPNITTWSEFGPDPHEDPVELSLPIKNPDGGQQGTTGRTNWVGGVNFRSNVSDDTRLSLGLSVANIGRISNSIAGKGSYSVAPLRFVLHGQYITPIADRIKIEPRLFFQFMQPSWEASLQALAHFKLDPEKHTVVKGGLGYNVQNGLQFLVGADIKDLTIGFSFDLNLTDKTAVSGAASAFELGVGYTLKYYKKPKPDGVLVCPRL